MSEQDLINIRKEKHIALGGGFPLAESQLNIDVALDLFNCLGVPISLEVEELKEFYRNHGYTRSNGLMSFHGRITSFRKSGSIAFIGLRDITGAIQLIASKKNLPNFTDLSNLDLGDIIEISGYLCKSKSGENSIAIVSFRLLTKCQKPLPEKWTGVVDTELKYRSRYLDLISNEESRAIIIARSIVLRTIRSYLDLNSFIEVETSTLNAVNSGANAKPFITHHNALDQDMFLRVAPELSLKKLVVGGMERVYEIGRCYRNEGLSTRHNPEFTMLEFYQAYGKFPELIEHAILLLQSIDNYFCCQDDGSCPSWMNKFFEQWKNERTFSLKRKDFKVVTMKDAVTLGLAKIGLKCNFQPFNSFVQDDVHRETFSLERSLKIDNLLLEANLKDCGTIGEFIFVLFEQVAEPFLTEDYRTEDGKFSCPVFITEYPSEICPLARKNDNNPGVCDRFELFLDGKEIANAFQELNNPDEQELRFREQLESNKKDPMDLDSNYIDALRCGLPPTIGYGMGICRLLMLLTCSKSIRDVITFPAMRKV